jgi:hypothetical protein
MFAVQKRPVRYSLKCGLFAGLSVLALISAMDMTNGGLYASIMQQYGSKAQATAILVNTSVPDLRNTVPVARTSMEAPIQKNHFFIHLLHGQATILDLLPRD